MKVLFLTSFSILLLLTACSSFNEDSIQGKWSFSETSTDSLNQTVSSTLTWEFNKGTFTVEGYPPLSQKGTYSIIQTLPDLMYLKLKNQEGDWGTEDKSLVIALNKDNTLMIDEKGPFSNVSTQPQD